MNIETYLFCLNMCYYWLTLPDTRLRLSDGALIEALPNWRLKCSNKVTQACLIMAWDWTEPQQDSDSGSRNTALEMRLRSLINMLVPLSCHSLVTAKANGEKTVPALHLLSCNWMTRWHSSTDWMAGTHCAFLTAPNIQYSLDKVTRTSPAVYRSCCLYKITRLSTKDSTLS